MALLNTLSPLAEEGKLEEAEAEEAVAEEDSLL